MLPLWAQWAVLGAALVGVGPVLLTAIVALFKLYRRLDRIDQGIQQLITQANGHLALTGSLIGALSRRGDLSPQDMANLLSTYTELARIPPVPTNPLSPDEYRRLTYYIDLARRGGPFTEEQVRDYQVIITKLEQESPKNRDIWPLVGLGALLLGMYLLGKRDE